MPTIEKSSDSDKIVPFPAKLEYHATVHDLPTDERPRERLQHYGPRALSNAELLAIILRTGTTRDNVLELSGKLLAKYGGLSGLMRAEFMELCNEYGLGAAKTAQLKAALINRYQGTVNSSVLRAAEIYRPAIIRNCPAVIICHNHPSGDPTPSPEDITVTEQLVAAGQHLDIELVDHLVIGNQRFVSLKERLRW